MGEKRDETDDAATVGEAQRFQHTVVEVPLKKKPWATIDLAATWSSAAASSPDSCTPCSSIVAPAPAAPAALLVPLLVVEALEVAVVLLAAAVLAAWAAWVALAVAVLVASVAGSTVGSTRAAWQRRSTANAAKRTFSQIMGEGHVQFGMKLSGSGGRWAA